MKWISFFNRNNKGGKVPVRNINNEIVEYSEPAEILTVKSLDSWKVTWYSPREFSQSLAYISEKCEFFVNEDNAKAFAESLKSAFKLTQSNPNYSRCISIKKSNYKGI